MLGISSGNAKVHIGAELVTAVRCERIHTKDWANRGTPLCVVTSVSDSNVAIRDTSLAIIGYDKHP